MYYKIKYNERYHIDEKLDVELIRFRDGDINLVGYFQIGDKRYRIDHINHCYKSLDPTELNIEGFKKYFDKKFYNHDPLLKYYGGHLGDFVFDIAYNGDLSAEFLSKAVFWYNHQRDPLGKKRTLDEVFSSNFDGKPQYHAGVEVNDNSISFYHTGVGSFGIGINLMSKVTIENVPPITQMSIFEQLTGRPWAHFKDKLINVSIKSGIIEYNILGLTFVNSGKDAIMYLYDEKRTTYEYEYFRDYRNNFNLSDDNYILGKSGERYYITKFAAQDYINVINVEIEKLQKRLDKLNVLKNDIEDLQF